MSEQFYTILTKQGKAKIANATALGDKVNLSKFQVGDGNGTYYNPTEDQTGLKHKTWEGPISSITVDENNPNWIVLEVIIPHDVGGFMIREAGVFDDSGNLMAIGKYPETYKPVVADGSTKDLIIKMILEVSNTSIVTLKVDPTVILATQKDIQTLNNRIGNIKVPVQSVNGKTGKVELTAADVKTSDGTTLEKFKEDVTTQYKDIKTKAEQAFQSGVEAKQNVVAALTSKKVNVTTENTWEEISAKINSIKQGNYSVGDIVQHDKIQEKLDITLEKNHLTLFQKGLTIDYLGNVYVITKDDEVVKYNEKGEECWKYKGYRLQDLNYNTYNNCVVVANIDDVVLLASDNGAVIKTIPNKFASLFIYNGIGEIYAANQTTLNKYTTDFAEKIWGFKTNADTGIRKVRTDKLDNVYIALQKIVIKINSHAKELWRKTIEEGIHCIAIDINGNLWVGTGIDKLIKFNSNGEEVLRLSANADASGFTSIFFKGTDLYYAIGNYVIKLNYKLKEIDRIKLYDTTYQCVLGLDCKIYANIRNRTITRITENYKIIG